jgi:hypothetical protein
MRETGVKSEILVYMPNLFDHAWHHIYTVLKIVIFSGGIFLVYVGVFLKEDSEGKLQNSLEVLWVSINDQESVSISKNVAFLRTVASVLTRGLDRLLGEHLFSLRALAVSSCYSLGSIFLSWVVIMLDSWFKNGYMKEYFDTLMWDLPMAAGLLCLGTLQGGIRRPIIYKAWYIAVLILSVIAFLLLYGEGLFDFGGFDGTPSPAVAVISFASTLLAGIAFDAAFIAATRYMLRRSSRMSSAFNIAEMVLINILVACLLVAAPAYFVHAPTYFIFPETATERVAGLVGTSNMIDLFVSLLFVMMALLLLAHRLVWPMLDVPVYALQRIGVIGRRKLMVLVGFMMLSFSTGFTFERLQKLFGLFYG